MPPDTFQFENLIDTKSNKNRDVIRSIYAIL